MTQTDRTITLVWTNSKADIDNYRVKYGPISGGVHNELLVRPGSGGTTKATISGEGSMKQVVGEQAGILPSYKHGNLRSCASIRA